MNGASRGAAVGWNSAVLWRVGLFLLGCIVLAGMSIAAHSLAYFPLDLATSQAVQAYHPDWLDTATSALSWTGYPPQSSVLFGAIVVLLFVLGARWGAVMEIVAAVGSGWLYLVLQGIVGQPRPSADLVRVAFALPMSGFPSGHLATFTAVFGFVAFLGYRRLSPSATRWLPPAFVATLLVLMSFARIYAGQHWASDALAGCLLGGLWLSVVVQLYSWSQRRFHRWTQEHSHAQPPDRAQVMLTPHETG